MAQSSMKTLGSTLSDRRKELKLTLRQVEEVTDISNAYLSLLENDKIKKPSANVLYQLSDLYKIEIKILFKAAGIIKNSEEKQNELYHQIAFRSEELNKLTAEEEDMLYKYLQFLRSQK